MKLVLSRKGFDSAAGGVPSPVLPTGEMLSLPIPYRGAPTTFTAIAWRGRSVGPLVAALSRLPPDATAHLDPDLRADARPRPPGWRPAFGQFAGAQTHLHRNGVGPGDLFLFYGWFRRTNADATAYVPGSPDEHALFGWLQIGTVLPVGTDLAAALRRHTWLRGHPHVHGHAVPSNTLYLAADRLVLDGRDMGVSGGGVFPRYHNGLRLTAPGSRNRSLWQLPGWLHRRLSWNPAPAQWGEPGDITTLRSSKQGQEFVADVPAAAVAHWVAALLHPCVDAHAPAG